MFISIIKWFLLIVLSGSFLIAETSVEGVRIFHNKCQLCHTTEAPESSNQSLLLGPSIETVMLKVKERYPIREDAIKFITDYILNPSINKALCPSLDKYGLMPSMKRILSPDDAKEVAKMLFDTFPRQIVKKFHFK